MAQELSLGKEPKIGGEDYRQTDSPDMSTVEKAESKPISPPEPSSAVPTYSQEEYRVDSNVEVYINF